jgi:hypothetical protein
MEESSSSVLLVKTEVSEISNQIKKRTFDAVSIEMKAD